MRTKCLNCGHEFEAKIYIECLGRYVYYAICPNCKTNIDAYSEIKEDLRHKIDGHRIEPEDSRGLENYHFSNLHGNICAYHYTEYKSSRGRNTSGWLCRHSWNKTKDGKWTTAIDGIGWKHKTVDSMEDIFDFYREMEENGKN